MKHALKSFTVETEKGRRKATLHAAMTPRLALADSPVEIFTTAPAIMTRAAPRDSAKRSGPPAASQSRAATFAPDSYDTYARTVQAVFSTGAAVKRLGFVETLNMDPSSVDLSRVAQGQCKLLDSHNSASIDAILGVVEEARIENGQLLGRIRFADTDAGRKAEEMVARGELSGLSIGYSVQKWTNVSIDDAEAWRADFWTLMELSTVAVPADAGAMVRNGPDGGEDAARAAPVAASDLRAARNLLARAEFFGQRTLAERLIDEGRDAATIIAAVQEASRQAGDVAASIGGPRLMTDVRFAALGESYHDNRRGHSMHMNMQTLDNPAFVRESLENPLYARMTGKRPEGARANSWARGSKTSTTFSPKRAASAVPGCRAAPAAFLAPRAGCIRRAIFRICCSAQVIACCRKAMRRLSRH